MLRSLLYLLRLYRRLRLMGLSSRAAWALTWARRD